MNSFVHKDEAVRFIIKAIRWQMPHRSLKEG